MKISARGAKKAITLITLIGMIINPSMVGMELKSETAQAAPQVDIFAKASRIIRYDVSAISISVPINGWGEINPLGMMYALNNPEAIPNVAQLRDPNFKLYDTTDQSVPHKIQPLVLRANVGDIIEINLRNELNENRNAGMQIMGLPYDPRTSDGAFIGKNPDTTVAPGQTRTYRWLADRAGGFLFRDSSNVQFPQDTVTKGLFGMVIVEPAGSTWRDSISGRNFLKATPQNSYNFADLVSVGMVNGKPVFLGVGASVYADIHQQAGAPLPKGTLLYETVAGGDYRDYAIIMHDEFEGLLSPVSFNDDGTIAALGHPVMPATGLPDDTILINYKSEPMRVRDGALIRHRMGMTVILPNGRRIGPQDDFGNGGIFPPDNARDGDPSYKFSQAVGEGASLDSWIFGDPAVPIPRAYWGDPVIVYVGSADAHDTHTFHQHIFRWFRDPDEADINNLPIPDSPIQKSNRLDVQGVGPGEVYKLVYEQGAGAMQGSAGDMIFHCHLYPHFAGGIWGLFRVFDKLRINFVDPAGINSTLPDGTPLYYPDGTQEAILQPLPARAALFNTVDPDAADNRALPPPGMPNRVPMPPDADHPGFPNFIAGKFGQKALQPPMFIIDPNTGQPTGDRAMPTLLERLASYDGISPGVVLVDPAAGPNHEFGNPGRKPDRIYEPMAVQFPFIQNAKGGFFNPEQRAYVEKELVEDVRRDPSKAEPYTFRMNVGDCVEIHTTNNLQPDEDTPTLGVNDGIFHGVTNTPEISNHMHFIRFDELGSSGTSVGWNYDVSVKAGQTGVFRLFVDVNVRTVFSHDHQFPTSHQQNGLWSAMFIEPKGSIYRNPVTGGQLGPATASPVINALTASGVNIKGVGVAADILVNEITGDVAGGISGGSISAFREFAVHYSDFTPSFVADPAALRAAFETLKQDPDSQAPFDPVLRTRPYLPPFHPDDIGADQGTTTLNYRVEPFQARINPDNPLATAAQKEPAYVFSSRIHGDPETAVFRVYAGDPVVFRMMDGAHEEHHTFEIHGHRWLHQPSNPKSIIIDNQAFNIAEYFNFELRGNTSLNGSTVTAPGGALSAGLPGDYLFNSTPMADLWNGLWGIFRVENGIKPDLRPLPNNPNPQFLPGLGLLERTVDPSNPVPKVTPELTLNNDPAPVGAPVKHFDIVAIQKSIRYNRGFNESDPFGLMFVLAVDERAVISGIKPPEPLIIRVNEGDKIEINLANHLPDLAALAARTSLTMPDGTLSRTSLDNNTLQHIGDAQMPAIVEGLPGQPRFVFAKWPMSRRVSLHPRLLKTVPSVGDGATVGFMPDQTVGPGESVTYIWHADKALGASPLEDYGDQRSHRHHGLFGALIVEPRNSIYLDPTDPRVTTAPLTARQIKSGASAVIHNTTTGEQFREFVPIFADGLNIRKGNSLILDSDEPVHAEEIPHNPISPEGVGGEDVEAQGEAGINYRTERLADRVAFARDAFGFIKEDIFNPLTYTVFSSSVHGDPETPVFESFVSDPVIFRPLRAADLAKPATIGITGHNWPHEPDDPDTNIVNSEGSFGVGKASNFPLIGGAGGLLEADGDYLYNTRNHVEKTLTVQGGLWGLLRVHPEGAFTRIRPLAKQGIPPPLVETLTVTRALFRALDKTWIVNGTSTVPGSRITVHFGSDLGGPVIGTAAVSTFGAWSLIVRNSSITAVAGDKISVESSGGATLLGIPVILR